MIDTITTSFSSLENSAYSVLITLVIVLASGIICGKLATIVKLPAITGYIFAGILIGPSLLGGLIPESHYIIESFNSIQIITEIALGFIGLNIGLELFIPAMKKYGKKVFIIAILEGVGAFIVTYLIVFLITGEAWEAIILGAIAVATAPTTCMMIIKKYRGKGELCSTLVPLVGVDDAVGIIIFGISLAVGSSLASGTGTLSFETALVEPLIEILLSITVGVVLGLILSSFNWLITKTTEKEEGLLDASILMVFVSVILAGAFDLSLILITMSFGLVFTNTIDKERYKFEESLLDGIEPPILMIFFILTGASMNLGVFLDPTILFLIIAFVIARILGKYSGAYLGARVTKSGESVKKYLGFTLIPQEGVAIAFASQAAAKLDTVNGELISSVTLGAVLISTIIGPLIVKWALKQSGELTL